MLVQHLLENAAHARPDSIALIEPENRYTYSVLNAEANRLANLLLALGLKRGDRVVIQLPNGADAVIAIFGVLKAGGVFVLVNPSTKAEKLRYILKNAGAQGLITAQCRVASECAQELRNLGVFIVAGGSGDVDGENIFRFSDRAAFPDATPRCGCIDLDLACLVYTSGSTGEPRGVMSDHSNVLFVVDSLTEYLKNTSVDIILSFLPLSFDYGLYQVFLAFRAGGGLIFGKSVAYIAEVLSTIERERVTALPGVPTLFALLCRANLSGFNLSSLRYVTNTGAALPTSRIQDLRRQLPNVRIYSMYGLTETKRTLYLPPEWIDTKPESVGIPIPGTEAWIEDDAGNRLAPGETGQLVVRGRHVMRGYWAAPEETAKRFRDGQVPGERLCYTGDLFRTDGDGCFYFVARSDDIIKSRGEKVAPIEVENVIHRIPEVLDAVVFGVPDPVLGQAVKAVIVPRSDTLTQAEVIAHCRRYLDETSVPVHVEFRAALPVTPNGKIAKGDLAACAGLRG